MLGCWEGSPGSLPNFTGGRVEAQPWYYFLLRDLVKVLSNLREGDRTMSSATFLSCSPTVGPGLSRAPNARFPWLSSRVHGEPTAAAAWPDHKRAAPHVSARPRGSRRRSPSRPGPAAIGPSPCCSASAWWCRPRWPARGPSCCSPGRGPSWGAGSRAEPCVSGPRAPRRGRPRWRCRSPACGSPRWSWRPTTRRRRRPARTRAASTRSGTSSCSASPEASCAGKVLPARASGRAPRGFPVHPAADSGPVTLSSPVQRGRCLRRAPRSSRAPEHTPRSVTARPQELPTLTWPHFAAPVPALGLLEPRLIASWCVLSFQWKKYCAPVTVRSGSFYF